MLNLQLKNLVCTTMPWPPFHAQGAVRLVGLKACEMRRSQMAAVALRNIQGTSRECLNADDIDAYPGAPGPSLGPHRTSRRQMVFTVGERPRATVRERR